VTAAHEAGAYHHLERLESVRSSSLHPTSPAGVLRERVKTYLLYIHVRLRKLLVGCHQFDGRGTEGILP
jgi:hypothetical protein